MESIDVDSIKTNSFYQTPLELDNQFILTIPPCCVNQNIINALKEWNFSEVYKSESKELITSTRALLSKKLEQNNIKSGNTESVSINSFVKNDDSNLSNIMPSEAVEQEVMYKVEKPIIQTISASDTDENKKNEIAEDVYNQYAEYIDKIFTRYATHNELNQEALNEAILELCNYIRENTKYILRVQPEFQKGADKQVVNHSLRSTIFSIAIALQLKMPLEKMVELGVACLLHEIGQLKIPPQLYAENKKLSSTEFAKMKQHAIYSYQILKDAKFPLTVQIAALEHHERENGSGYPQKLTGDKISMYAKIITVACSYEAITAPRDFKQSKTSFDAMFEILKNEKHDYDPTVIKALVSALSLYPIGSYIYLSNGKIALVVDVNPASPQCPIVEIISETDENGKKKKVQTDTQQLRVTRAMNKDEVKDLLASLNK